MYIGWSISGLLNSSSRILCNLARLTLYCSVIILEFSDSRSRYRWSRSNYSRAPPVGSGFLLLTRVDLLHLPFFAPILEISRVKYADDPTFLAAGKNRTRHRGNLENQP